MATKKKALKKAVPVKKVVTKNSPKFKRKNSDGTSGRKGKKIPAIWIDSRYLVDLLTKGLAPRIVLKMVNQVITRFDDKAFASLVHSILANLTEEKRNKLLKRYFPAVKMSAEDRKALSTGRKVLKLANG